MIRIATPAFKEFFAEPFLYDEGYGYAIDGITYNQDQAAEIFFKEFTENLVPEVHKYVRYYLRHNIKESYVKWHGFIADDDELHNGWVIHDDYYMKKGAKRVWRVNPDKHYFRTGHEYTLTIDKYGFPRYGWNNHDRDCSVCTEIKVLEQKLEAKV